MICCQFYIVAPATQAFVAEVGYKRLPLGGGVRSPRRVFSGAAAIRSRMYAVRVILTILAAVFIILFKVISSPTLVGLLYLFRVILLPASPILARTICMSLPPLTVSFRHLLSVVLVIPSIILLYLLRVSLAPLFVADFRAWRTISVFLPFVAATSNARFPVSSRHEKTPMALPQELTYNVPATRRYHGLSSRLGMLVASPRLLLVPYYTIGVIL